MLFICPKTVNARAYFFIRNFDLPLFFTRSLRRRKCGTIPNGDDFNMHFNLLFIIFFNLYIPFQSFSTEMQSSLPQSAKYVENEVLYATAPVKCFEKSSRPLFFPRRKNVFPVSKRANEDQSFSMFKKSFTFECKKFLCKVRHLLTLFGCYYQKRF